MARYKLILEYDGTNLIGFQRNKDGDSVQSLLEDAVFKFCGEHIDVVGCGRTDAGVHAIAMPAHLDIGKETDADTVKRAINFYLNDAPVSVVSCEKVSDDFHARFDCKKRHYIYYIQNQDFPPKLSRNAWWIPQKLNIEKMQVAASRLIGNHDFTSFRSIECQAKSPVKTLDSIKLHLANCTLQIEMTAQSFLHHQVRNIVGTLIEIGRGKPFDIEKILAAYDRSAAGPTAPAQGLFFVRAEY